MALFDNATFRAPDFNMGDNAGQFVNDVLNYRNNREMQQKNEEANLMEMQRQQRMRDIMNPPNPGANNPMGPTQHNILSGVPNMSGGNMPVVFKDLETPYQRGQLANAAERNRISEEKNQGQLDVAKQGMAIKADMANDPNYVAVPSKGGTIHYMDKRTGNIIDSGVAAGTQTDAEKNVAGINLENTKETNRESLEGKKQTGRAANIESRGQQLIKQIQERGKESRATKAAPGAYNPQNLPTQQLVAQKLAATKFINSNPNLGQYVSIDPNTGMVNVTKPDSGGMFGSSGPTPADYQKILDAIYPNGQAPQTPTSTGVFTDQGANTGKVRVRLPDGRIGMMDAQHATQPGITILGGGGEQ